MVVSTVAILYGTLVPSDYAIPSSWSEYDKWGHFLMFMSWTLFFGLVRFLKGNQSLFTIFITGTFFGLSIEVLQYLLPTGRHPEVMDFAADLSGTLLAIVILYFLANKITGLNPSSAG